MDPRTAAKVTAPDLLSAFHSDSQGATRTGEDSGSLKVFLVLFSDIEDGTIAAAETYSFAQLDNVMQRAHAHVSGGSGRGMLLFVSEEVPDAYRDAVSELES